MNSMPRIELKRENLHKILSLYRRELINNSYADSTVRTYLKYLKRFLLFGFEHIELDPEERIAEFINLQKSNVTRSQGYSAIKQFYIHIIQKTIPYQIKHRKKRNRLPEVWDREDILKLLDHVKNKKHRLILAMLYGSGLRVSEVTRIRISDIDPSRLHLKIRGSKGNKDRTTVISPILLEEIQRLSMDRPASDYLFITEKGTPYKVRTIQILMERARLSAGIMKRGSCHTLRHSFATHLMEDGISMKSIQKLLGHRNVDTTAVYVHVMSLREQTIKSPL